MDKPAKLMKLYENIGRQIRETRIQRGLTLEELAEKAGRNWSYLSQIERARSIPSIETLFAISEQLEIPISLLFETHRPRKEENYRTDAYHSKIMYLLKEVPPREKKTAVAVLKKIFKK